MAIILLFINKENVHPMYKEILNTNKRMFFARNPRNKSFVKKFHSVFLMPPAYVFITFSHIDFFCHFNCHIIKIALKWKKNVKLFNKALLTAQAICVEHEKKACCKKHWVSKRILNLFSFIFWSFSGLFA